MQRSGVLLCWDLHVEESLLVANASEGPAMRRLTLQLNLVYFHPACAQRNLSACTTRELLISGSLFPNIVGSECTLSVTVISAGAELPWQHGVLHGEANVMAGCGCAGGSIRQPAHFCGVVGLMPTYGRVSRYGLIAYGSSMDSVGPMTTTVHDAALMLNAMAGMQSAEMRVGRLGASRPPSSCPNTWLVHHLN